MPRNITSNLTLYLAAKGCQPSHEAVVSDDRNEPILTLEPLSDAMREGVEGTGWALSGLQKTTSHQFEGRWEGESTRSAYLFFHRVDGPEEVSIDVYLDETSRGVSGNLALVVDLKPLGTLGPVPDVLEALSAAALRQLPERVRRPVTLRFRLADAGSVVEDADAEVRIKVRLPKAVLQKGLESTVQFVRSVTADFGALLDADVIRTLSLEDDPLDGA